MANQLPINLAPEYSNELNNQSQNNLQFWENQMANLNPQAPVLTSQNVMPGYAQGVNNANQYANMALRNGQSGDFDMGSFLRGATNNAQLQGNATNLANTLGNFYGNANTANQYGAASAGRMGTEGNIANLASYTIPTQQTLSNYSTQDFINSLMNQYQNSQGGLGNIIGGGLGKIGGTIASGLMGQSSQTPSLTDNYYDEYTPP